MSAPAVQLTYRLIRRVAQPEPHEVNVVVLAFLANFVLLASYYILRPVRDAMATVFGVDQLQNLFTGTLVLTLIFSPAFAWLTDTFKLSRALPGVFWFIIANLLVFCLWFNATPESRVLAAAFYWWFSVINLFMVSVFWSLMVDVFTPAQASRLLPAITAGGSLGAIAGPLAATLLVKGVGISGLLIIAAAGLSIFIALTHRVMREKRRMHETHQETQTSTLDHQLRGNFLDGFRALFSSSYLLNQSAFMLLMTWVATIGYFLQTELVAKSFAGLAERTQALADIDLVVNISSALIALFGLSHFIKRFGVTGSLVLNPLLTGASFLLMSLSPTLLMVQAMQAVRRVTQYAIARPSREICFTVVPQESRYKAKNVIDTVVYRLGDLSAAWAQAGLRARGFGTYAALGLAVGACAVWALAAWSLGRQYETRRGGQSQT